MLLINCSCSRGPWGSGWIQADLRDNFGCALLERGGGEKLKLGTVAGRAKPGVIHHLRTKQPRLKGLLETQLKPPNYSSLPRLGLLFILQIRCQIPGALMQSLLPQFGGPSITICC